MRSLFSAGDYVILIISLTNEQIQEKVSQVRELLEFKQLFEGGKL